MSVEIKRNVTVLNVVNTARAKNVSGKLDMKQHIHPQRN